MSDLFPDMQQSISKLSELTAASLASIPRSPSIPEMMETYTAGEVCKRLKSIITAYMESLNPNEEVGVALTSFGVSHIVSVTEFKSIGPNLLIVNGFENGAPVTLVQHVSQLNFLLVPVPLAKPDAAPRRVIGFQAECSPLCRVRC